MDVRDLQRAIGGIVLESAYLERVLRAAFSALIGGEYAEVVGGRLMAAALIDDCRHVVEVHKGIGGTERAALVKSLRQCESVNHERNRVIHDDWAPRPGNVMVTLQGRHCQHEVTVTASTVTELDELADRIGSAADQLSAAVLAALGPPVGLRGARWPAPGREILAMVKAVVLADTHAPRRWRQCPPAVARHLRDADVILHAGDVCTAAVLDELSAYAPVRAVLGNNDGPDVAAWGAPPTLQFELAGLPVAMVHDSGAAAGRCARMRRRFPVAELVIFGHSHIPLDQVANGIRVFNPGSPTDRRRQPHGTIGLLHVDDGLLVGARIIPVDC